MISDLIECCTVLGTEHYICQECYAQSSDVHTQHPDATTTNIRGVKAGLRANKKQMTIQEFHDNYGHLGCIGPCVICSLAAGCMRRITKAIDAHVEVRRAHTFDGDILTWEHRADCGCKYMVVLRDRMSKAVKFLFLGTRDEAPSAFRVWIKNSRSKPEYQGMGYEYCTILHLDRAGEWGEESVEWHELSEALKFETRWTSPDSKKEASHAERTVGIAEVVTKCLLLQRALHHAWWVRCAKAAEFLLNHFPSTTTTATMPTDGDQARPLELITAGYISRRQCDRELSYWLAPGTPALVHDHKAKGSQMDRLKSTWKIAWGMYREQVTWWSPWTRMISHSKSYTAFKLNRGVSYIQWLNLTGLTDIKRSESQPGDFNEKVVIKFPELPAEIVNNAKKAVAMRQPLLTVKHAADELEGKTVFNTQPTVEIYNNVDQELGGSVTVFDSSGKELKVDNDTGELFSTEDQEPTFQPSTKPTASILSHVQIENLMNAEQTQSWINTIQDERDTAAAAPRSYTTVSTDRFVRVCKDIHKLPFHTHQLYHRWLIETVRHLDGRRITAEDLPLERGTYLQPGMVLPLPTGSYWHRLCQPHKAEEQALEQLNETITAMAVQGIIEEIQRHDGDSFQDQGKYSFAKTDITYEQQADFDLTTDIVRSIKFAAGCKRCDFSEKETRDIVDKIAGSVSRVIEADSADINEQTLFSILVFTDATDSEHYAGQAASKRRKAIAAGTIPAPKNTREALERDHKGWSDSISDEFNGLVNMGVLDEGPNSQGYTKAQLLEEGIDINIRKAVFVGLYHTHKFDKEGEIDRLKTRCALQGHPGNMKRGIHFTETFTPTPREDTARVIIALVVLFNLKRKTGDVEKAYCWAKLPPGDLIAVRYPPRLRRYHQQTKEELYMVLRKNLYGHPAAGRAWGELRDFEILKEFNGNGWTCIITEMDPCLFYFTFGNDWALASIHTDDIDGAGTSTEIMDMIFKRIDAIWKVKATDPEFMLGLKRTLVLDSAGKVESCELTMIPYIKGMADTFREYLPTKSVNTPFPDKTTLSKFDKPTEAEVLQYQKLGYNRAVGMIVWAVRHVCPKGKYGVSQLCGVMAIPGKKAWDSAMHMIAYLEQHCSEGIKFSAKGNSIPVCMVDASNKPDPFDGICQAGFCVLLGGGPVISKSFKLKHVGLSSEHNEYMGLTAALRAIVWLRQLLQEMGRTDMVDNATVVYGDNIQANRLCKEHFVTTGNQHIYQPYHWNRQCILEGHAIVKWIQTKMNISDVLTKAVTAELIRTLGDLLCGYGDLAAFLYMLESSPRLYTDDNHKLGGVSRK
jgi:hypothetical protein